MLINNRIMSNFYLNLAILFIIHEFKATQDLQDKPIVCTDIPIGKSYMSDI